MHFQLLGYWTWTGRTGLSTYEWNLPLCSRLLCSPGLKCIAHLEKLPPNGRLANNVAQCVEVEVQMGMAIGMGKTEGTWGGAAHVKGAI